MVVEVDGMGGSGAGQGSLLMRGKIGKMGMLSASSTSFLSHNFDRLDLPLAQVPKSARKRGLGVVRGLNFIDCYRVTLSASCTSLRITCSYTLHSALFMESFPKSAQIPQIFFTVFRAVSRDRGAKSAIPHPQRHVWSGCQLADSIPTRVATASLSLDPHPSRDTPPTSPRSHTTPGGTCT